MKMQKAYKINKKNKKNSQNLKKDFNYFLLEAMTGFEPVIKVLQTHALPLGYIAEYYKRYEFIIPK